MIRRLLVVLFIGAGLSVVCSAPVAQPVEHTDTLGDPLPPYALQRIGTVRFRHGAGVVNVAVSPDGKSVFSAGRPPLVASGLRLHERLEQIAASLDRVAVGAGTLPKGLLRLRQLLRRAL